MNTTERNKLVREIKEAILKVPETAESGDRAWTKEIKLRLERLAEKHDCDTCPNSKNGNKGWLYDQTWFTKSEKGRLKSVPFVMESEWRNNMEYIKYDFEKLLLANSPIKLMVFQSTASKPEEMQNRFREMESGINDYKYDNSGIYILACYVLKNGRHMFDIRIFEKKLGKKARPID